MVYLYFLLTVEEVADDTILSSDEEDVKEDLLASNIPTFASKYITEDNLNDLFNF